MTDTVSAENNMANRLVNENSPYLLQHAYNPVDWYPWGEEALQKAKAENKVILISIGYSACHWCHVMERESFEDIETAKLMNDYFINIKIDREERPDLDHIYMDAVQAMTGSGGWPLNVFLTPDTKPFYGGTYFPPVKAHNRIAWKEVLETINKVWHERKDEIMLQSENLTEHLKKSSRFAHLNNLNNSDDEIDLKDLVDTMFKNIMKAADTEWGGFGKAPKFPQTFTIKYLFQYYHFTKNEIALDQALLSINKMLEGGIYDHVGGGLARYSTDNEWLAPHFEKMLYDNALFIKVLCDAYQITGNSYYEKSIRKTIAFVTNELMNEEGGFYAALDADSEGEEGKFYVWTIAEVKKLLTVDSEIFCDFFNISQKGNWEGKNILRILKKPSEFALENKLDLDAFETSLEGSLKILLQARNKRIKPLLDDKILLGWNALMITALCKAASALNDDSYRVLAENSFQFLVKKFDSKVEEVGMYHTYKNGIAKYPAFLDDYAFLIESCIHLQEVNSNTFYLNKAKELTTHVINNFYDFDTGFLCFTNKNQTDVLVRKQEVYDGALPSGNSTMAEYLMYLSVIFDEKDWQTKAETMYKTLQKAIVSYPTSFANWAIYFLNKMYGTNEIVIAGKDFEGIRNSLMMNYIPNKIVMAGKNELKEFPLLNGKRFDESSTLYLCKNYHCEKPVHSIEKLLELLK